MEKDKSLVNKDYLLQKFPGKGGWTYAAIPEILQNKKAPFGWVKVRGNIDGFPLNQYKLMPMGNGKLFLPVRKEIRKKIGKKVGDFVKVTLYEDESPLKIPEEIILCFENEPKEAYEAFKNFQKESKKPIWIGYIKPKERKQK